ncbi:MAG: aldo/keto reductase [Ruminococcus sp.]|nr:aldo/keto reductase [Ruminococcus sp.]
MRYKHFENAGVDISELTVGTWGIAGANSAGVTWGDVDLDESIAAIRRMVENGVNMLDTAPIYGDGRSEEIVGQALKGIRDKVFLTTKFGSYISHFTGKSVRDNKYNSVEREIDESLKRLQTDYIDFYVMHWPDVNTPIEETMAVCNMLKEKGKIRFIGMSNSPQELVEEAMKYAKIDVIQPPFSMVNQSATELMKWATSKGIGTMTYGSLGAGILTGAIRKLPKPDPKDMRQAFYPFFKEPQFSNIMELLKTLDKIAAEHGKPVAQVSINWSTQKSFVGTALTGVNTPAQADENCSAFDWKLSDEEIALIDKELARLQIG